MPGYLANLAKRGAQILPAIRRRVFAPTIAVLLPRAGQEGEKHSSEVGGKTGSTPMRASESLLARTLPARGNEIDSGEVPHGPKNERDYPKAASPAVAEDPTSQTGISGADRAATPTRSARAHRRQDSRTTPFSKTVQAESATSGNWGETARQHRGQPGEQERSGKGFLKLPPKIEVEMGGDKSAARTAVELPRLSAPTPSDRVPRVTAERLTSQEPWQAEQNAAERVGPQPGSSQPLQIARREKATRTDENPGFPQPIAGTPTDRVPAVENPSRALAQAVPVAGRNERASRSFDGLPRVVPTSVGPGVERKQESPRLNIGRLEIQIIQEGAQGAGGVQNNARQSSGDAWERMDREHIRQLGGS